MLRHRTRDVDIFDEVLVAPRAYDPPAEVVGALAAIPAPKVVDLGGNIGLFALDVLRRYPSGTVTSVEADWKNLPIILECRERNPRDDWTIIDAAAGTHAGTVRFGAGNFADSAVVESGGLEVPMIDAFELFEGADFIKIDIEGSEWPILLDDRFSEIRAAAVVMEWHARGSPGGDLRGIVVEAFSAAGYQTRAGGDNHHGVVWAWRG